jgi:hypothetical protein
MKLKVISSLILIYLNFSLVISFQMIPLNIYNKTSIMSNRKSTVAIASVNVSKYNPLKECMMMCLQEESCSSGSINYTNSDCTLYNNQTVIMDFIESTDSLLFSKQKLQICLNTFYLDINNSICFPKLLNQFECNSSVQCLDSAGLVCINNICQCSDTINK